MLTSQLVHQLLIICPLSFLAGFVDAVAGGGGLISLPAFLFAGVPVHLAYGTNKFCSCFGTLISTGKYLKNGKITLKLALLSAAGALIGSAVGARMVLALSERVLQICLMVILPVVAVFLLFNRNLGQDEDSPQNISSQSLMLRAVATIGVSALDTLSAISGKYFFANMDQEGQHEVSRNGSCPVLTSFA